MFKYFPHTKADIDAMLKSLNISSIDELFKDVPESVIFNSDYDVPSYMSESELRTHFSELSKKTKNSRFFPDWVYMITTNQLLLTR